MGFIDFHGHSIKRNVFIYGPEFRENDYRYYESKLYESNKRIEEEIKYFLIELKMKINLFF